MLRASLGDALLTVAVAVAAARAGRPSPAVLAAGLAGVALGIERHAVARARWGYRPAMPTLGGVGLLPAETQCLEALQQTVTVGGVLAQQHQQHARAQEVLRKGGAAELSGGRGLGRRGDGPSILSRADGRPQPERSRSRSRSPRRRVR